MRKPPTLPPPTISPIHQPKDTDVTEVRTYKLITPLFGGGVEPGVVDSELTPIRGTAIRGHLRFWWRATRGWQYEALKDLKEAEDLIWGAASTEEKPRPSLVRIQVEGLERKNEVEFVTYRQRKNGQREQVSISDINSPLGYVAFPLRDMPNSKAIAGIQFQLTLTFPSDYKPDVEAALWAWETFGGIGARTRRGFGALCRTDIALSHINQVSLNLHENLKKYVQPATKWPQDVPHLSLDSTFYKITGAQKDPIDAWGLLVLKLKSFRQSRHSERGRSKWPEPDAIRGLTENHSKYHPPQRPIIEKFPRAVFGLPIIFQFKDEHKGDPSKTTLEGKHHNRLASPLIIRPIACLSNQAVGIALILETPQIPPDGLVLKTTGKPHHVDAELTHTQAHSIAPLNGNPEVLKKFLESI